MRAAKIRQAPRRVCGAGDAYNGGLAFYQVACTVLGASSSTFAAGRNGLQLKGSARRTLATTSSVRSEQANDSVHEAPTSTTAHEDSSHSANDAGIAIAQNDAPHPSNSDEAETAEKPRMNRMDRKKTFGLDKILPKRTQRHRNVATWKAHKEATLKEWSEDKPFVIRINSARVPPEDLYREGNKLRGGLRGAEEAWRRINEQRSRSQMPAKVASEPLSETSEPISSPADTTAEAPDDSGPHEAAEAQPRIRKEKSRPTLKAGSTSKFGSARRSESTQESAPLRPIYLTPQGLDPPSSPVTPAGILNDFGLARHAAHRAQRNIYIHMTKDLQSGVEVKDTVSTDPEEFATLLSTHLHSLRELSTAYRALPERTPEAIHQLETASWHNGTPVPPHWPHVEPRAAGLAPWEQVDSQKLTGKALLDEEIRRFEAFIKLTPQEVAARRGVLYEVRKLRRYCMMGALLETFGSSTTNLMRPDSDLDIRVHRLAEDEEKRTRSDDRGDIERCLRFMTRNDAVRGVWIAPTGRVGRFPIVNARHAASAIDVQLLWTTDASAQRKVTLMAIEEEPHLEIVYQIVRTMLAARRLLEVFGGGLGSYGTFCMVATALRWSPKNANPRNTPADSLLHVLRFFAMRLPHMAGLRRRDEHAAAMDASAALTSSLSSHTSGSSDAPSSTPTLPAGVRPAWYSRDTQPRAMWEKHQDRGNFVRYANRWKQPTSPAAIPYQDWLVSYPDPATKWNDLAVKAIGIKYIVATMRYYLKDLEARIETQDAVATGSHPSPAEEHPTRDSGDGGASNDFVHALGLGEKCNAAELAKDSKPKHIGNPDSLLAPLLGDYHNKVHKQRQTIEKYGAEVMQQEEGWLKDKETVWQLDMDAS